MQQIIGTTPLQIPGSRAFPVFQNLGPGIVYIDVDENVSTTSGLQLSIGTVFEFMSAGGGNSSIWIVSDTANTDLRILTIGA